MKGKVTTDPHEIAQWIRDGRDTGHVSVIFGTYQSGSRIAEALNETGVTANVLVADEAHRTARITPKAQRENSGMSDEERRIRDFTLCHDNDAFPATYRVYQTATPRIYDTSRVNRDLASDWIIRTMDDENHLRRRTVSQELCGSREKPVALRLSHHRGGSEWSRRLQNRQYARR